MVLLQAMALKLGKLRVLAFALLILAACAPAEAGTGIPPHLAARAAEADGAKAEILADNIVTMNELEAAALLVRDCVVDRDVTVEEFTFDNGDLGITMSVDASSDDGATATAGVESVYDDCFRTEFELVGEIYNYQNRLTAAEQEQLEKEWLACLSDFGLELDGVDKIQASIPDQTEAVFGCAKRLEEAGW